jgi:hypothetical protein
MQLETPNRRLCPPNRQTVQKSGVSGGIPTARCFPVADWINESREGQAQAQFPLVDLSELKIGDFSTEWKTQEIAKNRLFRQKTGLF